MTTRKRKNAEVVGAPVPAEGWVAVFFETSNDGYFDEDTVSTVRVACWANVGGRVVGLIPTAGGLASPESEPEFRTYVDARDRQGVANFLKNWDRNVEEEDEDEDDSDPEGDDEDEDDPE